MQCEQPFEVEVGPVHDVNRRRFGNQPVERVDVVQLAVGNMDEAGDAAAQIEKRVHLHGGLGAAEPRQGEQRQAKVDGGRVQGVDRVQQLQPQLLFGVKPSGLGDQPLGELGVHAPVPALVGAGQGGAPHGRADAHVARLGRLRREAGLDVAQALPVRQLGKGQHPEVLGAEERADAEVALVPLHDAREGRPGKKVHQLSEQGLAGVHGALASGGEIPKGHQTAPPRLSRHHQNMRKNVPYSCSYVNFGLS